MIQRRAGRTGKTGGASAARSLIAIDRIDHTPAVRNAPINRAIPGNANIECCSLLSATSLAVPSRDRYGRNRYAIRGAVRNPIKKAQAVT